MHAQLSHARRELERVQNERDRAREEARQCAPHRSAGCLHEVPLATNSLPVGVSSTSLDCAGGM